MGIGYRWLAGAQRPPRVWTGSSRAHATDRHRQVHKSKPRNNSHAPRKWRTVAPLRRASAATRIFRSRSNYVEYRHEGKEHVRVGRIGRTKEDETKEGETREGETREGRRTPSGDAED